MSSVIIQIVWKCVKKCEDIESMQMIFFFIIEERISYNFFDKPNAENMMNLVRKKNSKIIST